MKVDEGIFFGYSLTSKAYRVLNEISKKLEETYYVRFDDNYMKKFQSREGSIEEIFPVTGKVIAPTYNMFEEYMLLFDEPENAIHSEENAADNKIDNLKKIINDRCPTI